MVQYEITYSLALPNLLFKVRPLPSHVTALLLCNSSIGFLCSTGTFADKVGVLKQFLAFLLALGLARVRCGRPPDSTTLSALVQCSHG